MLTNAVRDRGIHVDTHFKQIVLYPQARGPVEVFNRKLIVARLLADKIGFVVLVFKNGYFYLVQQLAEDVINACQYLVANKCKLAEVQAKSYKLISEVE